VFKKISFFFIKWIFVFSICISFALVLLILYYSQDLPTLGSLNKEAENLKTVSILYSNKNTLKEYGNKTNNSIIYSELPSQLVTVLTATEDKKFFKHNGVDVTSILRAFYANYKAGYIKQGGSTITQQLAKMMFLSSTKTIKRKIQEALLSLQLERIFSKEQILTFYLNRAYFGAGKYGIKNAAKFYFDKEVGYLNLEESAMLVGLLKAPSKYSPKNNPELAKQRTNQVLNYLRKNNYISEEDIEYISQQDTDLTQFTNFNKQNQKYYFSDWIKSQIPDYIDEDDKQNISIKTTLDDELQQIAENTVVEFVQEYTNTLKNAQISLIAMSKDGAILTMIGGRDYSKSPFNRALYAYRQPGSAFKLFVFLTALENDYKLNDIFIDEPIALGDWYPENYNKKYYGMVTMKEAFAKSLNSVAVQISELVGTENVVKTARKLGIISKLDEHDPSVTLGTNELSLLELVSAYAVVVNGGNHILPYGITEIKENKNEIIYQRQTSGIGKVIDDKAANQMKELLFEVVKNGTGKNAGISELIEESNNGFSFRKKQYLIGGKTGTSQDYRDAWFIGYFNDTVVGIWIGNDDNSPMNFISGGSLPAKLWKSFVENVQEYEGFI